MSSSKENIPKRCPECGAIMTAELAQEMCPACLMRRAFTPSRSEASDDPALAETLDSDGTPGTEAPASFSTGTHGPELSDGQSFGDYTIVQRLGRGGMGTVYEADHIPTGRRVALKVLTHSLDNPDARARFLREGRLAASINHPNSVYVYGTEEIGNTPTISMELIRGGTLQQWVKSHGVLDARVAVDAVLQVIDGLEAADRKGVLHRDIKPANCFIDGSGTIKVGDFGLSISTGPRDEHEITNVTREGTFLGTPAFASPEQLRGEPLDRRSDIYSVGVTLFYLLTGQAPFSGDNMVQLLATVLDKPAPGVRSLRPEVPEQLDAIIQRCLQKSAGQRFPGYDALREALLPLSSLKPIPAPLGNRLIANVIDVFMISFIMSVVTYGWLWMVHGNLLIMPRFSAEDAFYNVLMTIGVIGVLVLYYALTEWHFGKTLGKHLVGLRVVDGDQRISLRQAMIRASIFAVLPNVPSVIYSVLTRDLSFDQMQQSPTQWFGMVAGFSHYLIAFGLFITARDHNGYAGIHDLVSGTRVICKPQLKARAVESSSPESFDAGDTSEMIGPYHVLQHLRRNEADRLVLAYDAKLLRRVWLHVLPAGSPEIDRELRNLARSTRLRWLGGRRSDIENWDCYEAPTGKPFTTAIEEGLRWEFIVTALRQLAHELTTTRDKDSIPPTVSLSHLWITEEGSMKVLPFAAAEINTSSAPSSGPDGAAIGLLRQAAQFVMKRTDLAQGDHARHWMPISGRQTLEQICRTQSVDEARIQLNALSSQPTVNVQRRSAALLAMSLAAPSLIFFTTLFASLALEQQKARMPKLAELSKVNVQLRIEKLVNRPDKQDRIAAIETWIAGNYRDVIADREQMNNLYAAIVLPQNEREALQQLIVEQTPSAEQTAAAKLVYDQVVSDTQAVITPAEMGFFSARGLLLVATAAWMELIWIPSMITALACRGGALLWAFGLALTNRRGERASRLRVFMRMLIGGLPAVAIAVCFFQSRLLGVQLLLCVSVIGISACTMISGRRLWHDQLAGTYLVAR